MGNPQPAEVKPHYFGQPTAPIPGLTKEQSAKVRASAAMAIEVRHKGLKALLSVIRAAEKQQLPHATLKILNSPNVLKMLEGAENRVMGTPTQNVDIKADVDVNVSATPKRTRALRMLSLLRHAGDEAIDITPQDEPEIVEAAVEDTPKPKPRKRKTPTK